MSEATPSDFQAALDAIVKEAALVCGADDANLRLVDGGLIYLAAHYGSIAIDPAPRRTEERFPAAEAIRTGRTIHIPDFNAVADQYPDSFNVTAPTRSVLTVPLPGAGTPVGALVVRRAGTAGFTDEQIALVESLAARAVNAPENVRLFKGQMIAERINGQSGDPEHHLLS